MSTAPKYVPGKGWVYPKVKQPMTEAARARLEERAALDKWRLQWGRLWARIGVETMRPVARRFLATPFATQIAASEVSDLLYVNPRVTLGDLTALALADYKLRFPQARGERLWVGRPVVLGPESNAWERRDAAALADYHCRFCGAKFRRLRKGMQSLEPQHENHARLCAVRSLAGVLIPVAPGEVNRAEDPETLQLAVGQLAAIVRAVVLAWASDVVEPSMLRFANLELS